VALERDLIFLAESGEEADPTGVGIRFIVDRHFDEINAEFAIAEGNGGTIENGRVRTVEISTSEKVPRRVRLVATGTSGHGSVPRLDNAVTHLARAVEKVGTWVQILAVRRFECPAFAISRDGRWMLYSRLDEWGSDIHMLEHLR
jgi:acetylornithine deacetylase/succinyl-diaminopimelate desuccinylase-like protein